MNDNETKINRILQGGFYLFIFIYWIKITYLGIALTKVNSLGSALGILDNHGLYLIQVIRYYLANTQGIYSFFWQCLKNLPISTIILVFIWWNFGLERKFNRIMISTLTILPLVFLLMFLIMMNQQTLGAGFGVAHLLGYSLFVFGLGNLFYIAIRILFPKQDVKIEN